MAAIFADSPGTAVKKYSTIKKAVKSFSHFISKTAILVLKTFAPAILQFFPVVINNSIKNLVGRITTRVLLGMNSGPLPEPASS